MLVAVVFMGSEKYPATNDFDLFIKSHGGNTNAHTDYEKVGGGDGWVVRGGKNG